MRKYDYYKVIQQNYAGYYEDASLYECNSCGVMTKANKDLLKHDLKEYRTLGYPTRVIFRRELNSATLADKVKP